MLYKGRIIASGTPEQILRHPDPHLREFISTSQAVELLPPDPALANPGDGGAHNRTDPA
jgi:ABC-type transporter Mla maintaining outer membrane lipid asymmetry ATPase subunit MlaF